MVRAVPDILAQIAEEKRREIAALSPRVESLLPAAHSSIATRRHFHAALSSRPIAVIAEIKQASPSKGVLSENFNPVRIAQQYAEGRAAALSVLTDQKYFRGSLDDLAAARAAVTLPVLRKDFTLDESQIVEAAAHSADAILLIAALLTRDQLRTLREAAARYQMAALVEVHDEAELEEALASGAGIVGVNNRDLRTFSVSLDVSLRLAPRIPSSVLAVAESGIHTRADIDRLRDAGFRGFLIGERLMRAPDPARALQDLLA
jgi:indole-3-glycerol phosphate synthase